MRAVARIDRGGAVGRAPHRLPNLLIRSKVPTPSEAPQATAAEVDPIIVRQILADLGRRPADAEALLRGLGFGPQDLESYEFRVSYAQTSRVIRRALRLTGSHGLAQRLGLELNPVSWGLALVGLMASTTMQEMLEFAVDFLPSTKRMLDLSWELQDGHFVVTAEPVYDEPDVAAFLVETAFASLVRVVRFVVDAGYTARSAEFRHEGAADGAALLATGTAYGRSSDRLVLPLVDTPIATADPVVARMCRRVLTLQRTAVAARSELEEAVVRMVRTALKSPPTADAFAASMNISERTLRRRLQESGASYAALIDQERQRAVMAMLRDGEKTFGEVAEACGFADARSLRRAFKRWTGRTPSQVRQETEAEAATSSSEGGAGGDVNGA